MLTSATPHDVQRVRAIVRAIAKKFKQRVSVRKGKGSMAGTVNVGSDHRIEDPAMRVEILRALMSAEYEAALAPISGVTLECMINLSLAHEHAALALHVAPKD